MKIAVFGLGYVGSVSAACFAKRGHTVLGVDPDERKTQAILAGAAPQSEPGLADLIRAGVEAGRLSTAATAAEAVAATDLALVCVGTPSGAGGAADLTALERVSAEIAAALEGRDEPYGVVIRSTCLPGTLDRIRGWFTAAGAGEEGHRFHLATNPEFLREGSALDDFDAPPFTVVGTRSEAFAETIRTLYAGIDAGFFAVEVEVAEAMKVACNAFHAAKVTFANEVGRWARTLGADGRRVMEILCEDRTLNISKAYLRPGFAYGGSCLPKDVRALVASARRSDLELPLLASLEESNRRLVEEAGRLVTDRGRPRTAMIGLSFKDDTDDLRESPFVRLAEHLVGKGVDLAVLDPDVSWSEVYGANRKYAERELPHLAGLLVEGFESLSERDAVVVSKRVPGLDAFLAALPADAFVLDLTGAVEDPAALACEVRGITW